MFHQQYLLVVFESFTQGDRHRRIDLVRVPAMAEARKYISADILLTSLRKSANFEVFFLTILHFGPVSVNVT